MSNYYGDQFSSNTSLTNPTTTEAGYKSSKLWQHKLTDHSVARVVFANSKAAIIATDADKDRIVRWFEARDILGADEVVRMALVRAQQEGWKYIEVRDRSLDLIAKIYLPYVKG
jgi:hypothetical protein